MNVIAGFKAVIKYPFIVMIPIIVQVLISFLLGFKLLLGVDFMPQILLGNGEESETLIQFMLPVMVPTIEEMDQSLTFLPSIGGDTVFPVVLGFVIYALLMSFTTAVFLGSIKKVIVPGAEHEKSPLQSGVYYFGRIFFFWLYFYLLLMAAFFLLVFFWPLGFVLLLGVFIFMLTPHIIVLEDESLEKAFNASPILLKRYMKQFLPLVIVALLSTGVLSYVIYTYDFSEPVTYYIMIIAYTFIGSGFIAAFMHLLYQCIHPEQNQEEETFMSFRYPLWKRIVAGIVIFVLPLPGVYFAGGNHVTGIAAKDNITMSDGTAFLSDWSDAYRGSDDTMSTYEFDQDNQMGISLTLPDDTSSNKSLFGVGDLTWKVHEEQVTKNGGSVTYSGEEVFDDADFIYRLEPSGKGDDPYYSTLDGGFVKLMGANKSSYPIDMEMFVMNGGKDVFVYQYSERNVSDSVKEPNVTGKYLLPETTEVNPKEFKYFWYSEEPMTKERITDFLHAKNKEINPMMSDPLYFESENVVAALLQETDGESLVDFAEESYDEGTKENITDKNVDEWSEITERLYGDANLDDFLDYVNQANEHDAYLSRSVESGKEKETEITVPFPEGEMEINSLREDGKIEELEVEVVEGAE